LGILRVHERKKKEYQHVADAAGVYGIGIVRFFGIGIRRRKQYEAAWGIWLNLSRLEVRQSAIVLGGISAFMNGVPLQMFRALADTDEEANALHNLHQARVKASDTTPNFEGLEPGDLAGEK
jgi:hypothetical protein